jgi:hypothetical protein
MNITLIIGIAGAFILLVFFMLEQANKVSNESLWYDSANFIGSVLLTIYAVLLFSIPFAILNGVWAIFSLKDVFIDLNRMRKEKEPQIVVPKA